MSILLKKITMLIISSMVASITFAQNTTTVTGFVIDDNGNVLPGVTVTPKGKGPGVITNNEGKFVITIPNNTKLQFTYIGFDSKEVLPNGKVMNVQLRPSSVSLQETVVVGYGSQSRKTLTTSISKLNGDKVEGLPISTLGEGLKGKLSGTRFYSTNNSPGQDVTIRIRGGSSINKSNDPLILVDGIERPMSGISSNDIKSIEVLKDAASTAIYGSRASNGVVLITTKNGLANQAPIITFEATLATQSAETKYDFMNARDYINIVRPAVAKAPISISMTRTAIQQALVILSLQSIPLVISELEKAFQMAMNQCQILLILQKLLYSKIMIGNLKYIRLHFGKITMLVLMEAEIR